MKAKVSGILFLILMWCAIFATQDVRSQQAPKAINYQGIARTDYGTVLFNQTMNLKINILKDSPNGPILYTEKHTVSTNQFGIFTLMIGRGTVLAGDFSSIHWSQSNQWMRVDMDALNMGVYHQMGAVEFLSVPYAFFAEQTSASNASTLSSTGLSDNNNDPGLSTCTGTAVSFVNSGPIAIADNSTLTRTFIVSGLTDNVCMVNLAIDVNHAHDSDLKITLTDPSGTVVVLANANGGAGQNFSITNFADSASQSITSGTAPFNGNYKPIESLSAFSGHVANGTWSLKLIDQSLGFSGLFTSATLYITPAAPAVYSFVGETQVTINSSESNIIKSAYSVKEGDVLDVGIMVSRDAVSGAASTGTVIGYSAVSPNGLNKYVSLKVSDRDSGLSPGTYYYKLWKVSTPVAGTENYSLIVTKEE